MGWRSKDIEEPVRLPHDLLAAYEATREPAGRRTGLPAAPRGHAEPDVPPPPTARVVPAAPPVGLVRIPDSVGDPPAADVAPLPVDRRAARRYDTALPVLATLPGDDDGALGRCVNVGSGGLLVAMPFEAPDRHLDVVVGDDECSLVWTKVVGERAIDGAVLWHLQVVTADDAWHGLVARAAAAARAD
jgi:hypothetical protein